MEQQRKEKGMIFLDGDAVERNVDLEKLITSLEKGISNFSKGREGGVAQPVRASIPVQEHNGVLLVMPAYSSNDNALGTKLITLYRDNPERGLPGHQGVVLVFDPETGAPQAVMDAEVLTAIRTAAATAVATKHLSKDDAKTLAIIGAGVQARSHFKLLSLVRKFSEVRVWSRTKRSCEKFCQEIKARACSSVEEAVKDADVIVTVTTSKEPLVCAKWIKQGALVNVIGACLPDWREVDDDLMHNSQIIVDTKEGAMKESGDIVLSKATIHGELGEVILGTVKADFSRMRVFKSLGMAVQDAIAGKHVLDKYRQNVSKQ